MMKSRSGNGGYTLTELMFAIVISSLAILATFSVFIATTKMSVEAAYRTRAENEVRIIVDNLTTDVRSAINIENSYSGCGNTYTSGSTTLILMVPSIEADGTPVNINTTFDRIIYHSNNSTPPDIIRTVCPNDASSRPAESRNLGASTRPQLRIDGAYQVQPDALGAYVVHYEFTATQKHAATEYSKPLAGSIRLRNKV